MLSIFFLAVGLAMDALAASLSQGARARPLPRQREMLRLALAFGIAQSLMPVAGWALGQAFQTLIRDIDHWVAFVVLSAIGVHMIYEGRTARADVEAGERVSVATGWPLLAMAVATSIDAAAAGVTLAFLDQAITAAAALIGIVTFVLCYVGVWIGAAAGRLAGVWAQLFGGLLLIALGVKILVEHVYFGGG